MSKKGRSSPIEAVAVAFFGGGMVFVLAATWIGSNFYGLVAWIGFSAIIFVIYRKYHPLGFVMSGLALLFVGLLALAIGVDITHSRLASVIISIAAMATPIFVIRSIRKRGMVPPGGVVTADFWRALE